MIKKNLENKKTQWNHEEKDTKREIKRRGGKKKPKQEIEIKKRHLRLWTIEDEALSKGPQSR
jgi:hypothetical protein